MWKHVGKSLPGTAHIAISLPCQDAHYVTCDLISSTLIAACSDGAGSATHSHFGSELVCSEVMKLCQQHLIMMGGPNSITPEIIHDWIQHLHRVLDEAAFSHGVNRRELASTLLLTIVGVDCACFFQIGDGAIVFSINGSFETAFWPQSGEYVNTTNFITDHNAPANAMFRKVDLSVDQVALFTDGLERLVLKFHDQTVHVPFFQHMFSAVSRLSMNQLEMDLEQFLTSESVNSRTDDDKTLILACRIPG